MNDSGSALSGLRARTPEETLPDLLVLVDDFAIPVGTFRLRGSGSAGGHNGLKSIERAVGTRNYPRLRIGVGPVPEGVPHHDYVLEPMPKAERRLVEELLPAMVEAVECWMGEGIEAAMNRYNRKVSDESAP
jgi:peptidyl-tRNA hydrolase, PTH1 family